MIHDWLKTYPAVVIPAYQPDEQLFVLVRELRKKNPHQMIIVVNDGSDSSFLTLFESLGNLRVEVLHHSKNQGKGQALKTAFAYYIQLAGTHALGVVTADSDGQHSAEDIILLSDALAANAQDLHLGVRDFSGSFMKISEIPWRSRIGNLLTAYIFRRVSATKLYDTQTGLRGIPMRLLKLLLNSRFQGYELEMEMLLMASFHRLNIRQIPIKTIYYNRNARSHFNPFIDSIKIIRVIIYFLLTQKGGS